MESYVHKEIFRTKLNIYDGAFLTLVKPNFKSVHNLIELPLGSVFCTTYPFVKKLATEKFVRKSLLLAIEQFLFLKFEIMQWNGIINKEGFFN